MGNKQQHACVNGAIHFYLSVKNLWYRYSNLRYNITSKMTHYNDKQRVPKGYYQATTLKHDPTNTNRRNRSGGIILPYGY